MNCNRKSNSLSTVLFCVLTLLITIQNSYGQTGYPLTPVSGADGVFEIVIIEGDIVNRSTGNGDTYSSFMYFQCNLEIQSSTVYVEVTYKDIGYGPFGLEYNSTTEDYYDATVKYGNYVQNTNGKRTAVFELKNANFRNAQNLSSDLRLYSETSLQKHIISAFVFLEPPQSFLNYQEDWISPYEGPEYIGDHLVDATSLTGKVICGYQGWFRAVDDGTGEGWTQFRNNNFNEPGIELWPDMSEYTVEEKYAVPEWTHANGNQAFLFSSANKKTVIRHFQWMETYGIDGVAIQRFVGGLDTRSPDKNFRIASYAREAANRTGRTYFIMYDMSGGEDLEKIIADWHYLVDIMKITSDDRYLHHDGKPVVGIFGFFADRFEAAFGNQVLDIFQKGGQYEGYVVGSGQDSWRKETAPGWPELFRRMDAWIPWQAETSSWLEDKNEMTSSGVLYMAMIHPGFGWDNMLNLPPGTSTVPRLKGAFMWQQFVEANNINAESVYVGMFDEIDEGTAIFKVTNDIPVNHYFLTLEGLPSDFYLLMTGFGTSIINGSVEMPDSMPDFASQSQPPIPDIISPVYGDTVFNPVSISWTNVSHLSGINIYELEIDGNITSETTTEIELNDFELGIHRIRVRAINGLLNKSSYSEAVEFVVASTVGVKQIENMLPNEFGLYQNYPNPFNSSTKIGWQSPVASWQTLKIYDVLGNEIATLVDEYREAGIYEIEFIPSSINHHPSSEIYFYRIQAEGFSQTRKMIQTENH
ncbi:MAG: hypothetical protein R6W31_00715 [Bacteroidales bacterium]